MIADGERLATSAVAGAAPALEVDRPELIGLFSRTKRTRALRLCDALARACEPAFQQDAPDGAARRRCAVSFLRQPAQFSGAPTAMLLAGGPHTLLPDRADRPRMLLW